MLPFSLRNCKKGRVGHSYHQLTNEYQHNLSADCHLYRLEPMLLNLGDQISTKTINQSVQTRQVQQHFSQNAVLYSNCRCVLRLCFTWAIIPFPEEWQCNCDSCSLVKKHDSEFYPNSFACQKVFILHAAVCLQWAAGMRCFSPGVCQTFHTFISHIPNAITHNPNNLIPQQL